MSVQAISWVLESSKAKLGARLALLSIANHADRKGENAWPSVATIAREARMSARQIQNVLRDLVALGELQIEPNAGPKGTNVYRLPGLMEPILPLQERRGGENIAPLKNQEGGEKSDTQGVKNPTQKGANISPEPSLTVLEPAVANATEPSARSLAKPKPVDPAKRTFDLGKEILGKQAGGLIQRWRGQIGDTELQRVLVEANSRERHDMVAYVTKAVANVTSRRAGDATPGRAHSLESLKEQGLIS